MFNAENVPNTFHACMKQDVIFLVLCIRWCRSECFKWITLKIKFIHLKVVRLHMMPTSLQRQWAWFKKPKVECKAQTGMWQYSTFTLKAYHRCVLSPICQNQRKWPNIYYRLVPWWAKQLPQVACASGRSEVLRGLEYYLRAQSQRHHTTDHLEKKATSRETKS